MPTYAFKGRNRLNELVAGEKVAASQDELRALLRREQIVMTQASEKGREISIPKLGSFIASGNFTSAERGLESFPREDRPPVLIPFFAFRIMVGMGLIMLAVSWFGNFLRWRGRLESSRWFLWCTFAAFPKRTSMAWTPSRNRGPAA